MKTYLFSLAALVFALGACTDPIELDSAFEEAQPVVDAWLTDAATPQTINLWLTQDYFANEVPPALTGATVEVVSSSTPGTPFVFVENTPGQYTWTPDTQDDRLGVVGDTFTLRVSGEVLGEQRTLISTSVLNRVPSIDSISVRLEEGLIGLEDGLYAQVYARDIPGVGDRYLIRSTINDTLLNRPGELNLAADAAFDGGTASDGIPFILPIRFAINKVDDDGAAVALVAGDVIEVEVWSLTEEAFRFLGNAQEQILNADAGLFSVPVVSTLGNVVDANSSEPALGMFSVSAVSEAMKEVD